MKCVCGADAALRTPDYGYGYGAEYQCPRAWNAHGQGEYRFVVSGPEAQKDSAAAFGQSRANADAWKRSRS